MEKKDINLVLSYGAIEPPKKIIKKRLGYVKYFSYIYKVNVWEFPQNINLKTNKL